MRHLMHSHGFNIVTCSYLLQPYSLQIVQNNKNRIWVQQEFWEFPLKLETNIENSVCYTM